ncbi:MAG: hypothetical protein IT273_14565 [Chitinophagales bacterium]|nr:hypothetical protein [Chitinophagales bacterium]
MTVTNLRQEIEIDDENRMKQELDAQDIFTKSAINAGKMAFSTIMSLGFVQKTLRKTVEGLANFLVQIVAHHPIDESDKEQPPLIILQIAGNGKAYFVMYKTYITETDKNETHYVLTKPLKIGQALNRVAGGSQKTHISDDAASLNVSDLLEQIPEFMSGLSKQE